MPEILDSFPTISLIKHKVSERCCTYAEHMCNKTAKRALLILFANIFRLKKYKFQGVCIYISPYQQIVTFPFISPHTLNLHNLMIYQDKRETKSKQKLAFP